MNIQDKHEKDKAVSAKVLFEGSEGKVTAIQVLANELLAEHISKIPAMLLCVNGAVRFEAVDGTDRILKPGDYIDIIPMLKHKFRAQENSQLVLMK